MKTDWKTIRSIIGTSETGKQPLLSLINEDGTIVCANSSMVKTLHLQDVRTNKTSFLDLLHPLHLDEFRQALQDSSQQNKPASVELYLKNGYYHPMKWQVNHLLAENGDASYLCVGHKILDDERDALFNVFMKQTPNLAWVVDENTSLVFGSRSFFDYFNLAEEESLGKKIADLLPIGVSRSMYE